MVIRILKRVKVSEADELGVMFNGPGHKGHEASDGVPGWSARPQNTGNMSPWLQTATSSPASGNIWNTRESLMQIGWGVWVCGAQTARFKDFEAKQVRT